MVAHEERVNQKRNGLIFGNFKSGFTLIELIIVIAIIGILMAVITPGINRLRPGKERILFVSKLNMLMRFAWQNAISQRTTHQVEFDFDKKLVTLAMETGNFKEGKPEYAPIKGAYIPSTLKIPRSVDIKNFIIEETDEMARSSKRAGAWFFIVPQGLAQAVTINFTDNKEKTGAGKPRQFGLVLNPFSVQFKLYDNFQK